jgi:sugar phosphate isomerase/epimerase
MVLPKLGLSMLYCLGEAFYDMVDRLAEVEVEYIEIVDDGFHSLNKRRVSALREIGVSHGLRYSVHAPFADVNIASPSPPMLRAMVKRLEQSIMHAQALGAYVWVFHPGMKTGISSFYPSVDWLQNLKTAQTLARIAEEYGVKIAVENVPEPLPCLMKSVEDFARFYAQSSGDISMVLDVGHSNVNGQTERFLNVFADRIVHLHLSDNDGKSDQHLGIGHGTVNWGIVASLLKKLRYDRTVVVESVEDVEESLQRLRQLFA